MKEPKDLRNLRDIGSVEAAISETRIAESPAIGKTVPVSKGRSESNATKLNNKNERSKWINRSFQSVNIHAHPAPYNG